MVKVRYTRQSMLPGWQQHELDLAQVWVIGAGTIGNEVIKNLALLGVGNIYIVDNDVVEEVNLSRCVLFSEEDIGQNKAEVAARKAVQINPYIAVHPVAKDVVYDLGSLAYRNASCVISTVDNLLARQWINRYCWRAGVPLIDTGIHGWIANVFVVLPPRTPCLECSWTTIEYTRLGERHSCSRIGLVWVEDKIPMIVTSGAIAASIAVNEVVKCIIYGEEKLDHTVYWFDGEVGAFLKWRHEKKSRCPHQEFMPVDSSRVLFKIGLNARVSDILDKARNILRCNEVQLSHDKDVVYSALCRSCGYEQPIDPVLLGRFRRLLCPKCKHLQMIPGEISPMLREGYTLKDLGIPEDHLLQLDYVKDGRKTVYIATFEE